MNLKGFLAGVTTSATFGLIPLFTLPLMAEGMLFPSILFYRFFVAALMLGVILFIQRLSLKITFKELLTLIVLSFLYDGSAVFLFWGYEYMASGIATSINFLYPVFVAALMIWGFKEKSSFWTFLSIGLAVLGVGFLSWGGQSNGVSFRGVVLVTISALSYALYIVGVNKSGVREMGASKLTLYVFFFGSMILLVPMLFNGTLQHVPSLKADFNITMLALLPTVVSNLALVYAIKSIGSTPTSVLGAMEPLTAMAVGVWVFHEPFTRSIAWGIAFIILAVILVIAGDSLSVFWRVFFRRFKYFYITEVLGKHKKLRLPR